MSTCKPYLAKNNNFQVDVVCHGQTPTMSDTDGKDPYEVR